MKINTPTVVRSIQRDLVRTVLINIYLFTWASCCEDQNRTGKLLKTS